MPAAVASSWEGMTLICSPAAGLGTVFSSNFRSPGSLSLRSPELLHRIKNNLKPLEVA